MLPPLFLSCLIWFLVLWPFSICPMFLVFALSGFLPGFSVLFVLSVCYFFLPCVCSFAFVCVLFSVLCSPWFSLSCAPLLFFCLFVCSLSFPSLRGLFSSFYNQRMPSFRASWGWGIAGGRRGPWLKRFWCLYYWNGSWGRRWWIVFWNGVVFLIKIVIFNLAYELLTFNN